ncbi:50S ribosomal protein L9 [Blochmannia endosymbiont of Camponotus (Colobopsis) obliquus]|uniref:50S ribosomal protein L9 n=1 Tax=Blochmannia endosymbiont of Camponotus (Colobopsis) obliquus TaxID=1505597 RepID=UPI00061A652E|nr:50S ribosomal protein L9 [Blochmannia endosymbiont of Camponotus (Colobopsis) obliquus]AKC60266.1 50S ribosomal protein L9 [Blochmannia endosymbiont of Camponotus (Colobopsis) obliquus]
MQVILLNKVDRLGEIGTLVNVKAGYARNFLFPQGKAITATKKNLLYFKNTQLKLQEKLIESHAIAKIRLEKLNKLGSIIILSNKVGVGGKLFGSIGALEIANAITNLGVQVSKNEVKLPNKRGLRVIGDHEIKVQLCSDLYSTLIITVKSQV